jgi:peptide/nickel transport system substrate-binding protein
MFKGQGVIQQATSLPFSPYYVEEASKAYTEYKPDQANAILDELGLDQLDTDGFRMRPDGEPLTITFIYWDAIGMGASVEMISDIMRTSMKLKVVPKPMERNARQELVENGEFDLTCWVTGGTPLVGFLPWWAVAGIAHHLANDWGRWLTSDGAEGTEPPEEQKRQYQRWLDLRAATSAEERVRLAKEINTSQGENLWSIGTVGLAPVPVVASNRFVNVPENVPILDWGSRFATPFRPESWFLKA